MGRAERSTAAKLDVVVVAVAVVDGVAALPVADVAASVVAGLPALLQDARRIATINMPRRIARDYIPTLKAPFEANLVSRTRLALRPLGPGKPLARPGRLEHPTS
jgi:hypothetical protein